MMVVVVIVVVVVVMVVVVAWWWWWWLQGWSGGGGCSRGGGGGNNDPMLGYKFFQGAVFYGSQTQSFWVGTNLSLGFQNCLMSMHELPSVTVQYTFPPR